MSPTIPPLKHWNTYEILWFLCFTILAIVLCILWKNSLFDFSVFLSGVFCVLLAAKGNIWNYAFGLYNSFVYAYLSYQNGLYGEMGLNLFFYVPTGILGYFLWKPQLNGAFVKMRALTLNQTLWVLLVSMLCVAGMGWGLTQIKGQNTPYIDATTNVLSIIATILMMYRYREQWLLYILLNIFTVLMWSIRTVNGSAEGPLMIVMWSAYLVNAIYGYWNWHLGASTSLSDRASASLSDRASASLSDRSLSEAEAQPYKYMKTRGLTLGKYAPFHIGHQYVIETALAEVDELVVLIYDTSVTSIPLSIRANWIRQLYPQVTVIEAWDGPEGYSTDRAFEIEQEEYIIHMLAGRKITHFYSSEFYGDHVSKALGAVDRRVDEARQAVPISATMIRENPFQYRNYIADVVYKDLITKVVFLGAMSTGKSTLTEALAQHYHTTFMPEYGREYWTQHQVDRRISLEAFDEIAIGHLEREEQALLQANRYLFVDTNAITTYMYALDYHGKAPALLSQLALENAQRYDLFFLCDVNIPYDDTWDRSGDQKRQVFQKQIIADLHERRIPYILLRGSVEERMAKVAAVLQEFEPFSNYFGQGK